VAKAEMARKTGSKMTMKRIGPPKTGEVSNLRME
jgi:hypothetical protein